MYTEYLYMYIIDVTVFVRTQSQHLCCAGMEEEEETIELSTDVTILVFVAPWNRFKFLHL